MIMQQHRRRGSLSGRTMKEPDEDLVLFYEMQKREREQERRQSMESVGEEEENPTAGTTRGSNNKPVNSAMSRMASSTPGRAKGADDIFGSDWDKNDYDWLSDGFSLNGSHYGRSLAALKTSRFENSKSGPPSRSEPLASVVCGNLDFQHPSNTVLSLSSYTETASRRDLSKTSNSVSRFSSSSLHAVARPSTPSSNLVTQHASPSSNFVARTSSPCARMGTPRLSTPSVRPSTPSGRATTPSKRPTSSTRSSTPVTRSSTSSSYHSNPPISLTRSSSTSKVSSLSSKSAASARTSSPTSRYRDLQLPGFSQEPPPNLRTSLPERSTSNTRGTSLESRPREPTTTRSTQAEATNEDRRNKRLSGATTVRNTLAKEPDAITRNRRPSSSPLVTRGRLSSDFQNGDKAIHKNGKLHDGVRETPVSNATVSKTVEKQIRSRKASVSAHEEQVMNSHVKRTMKSSPTIRDTKSINLSAQESVGFGRNLSKKSLDMALRHMDIRRSTASGFRSFMSNVPASSLYSVKSGHGRCRSNGTTVDSSIATSSNASSEYSMNIVPDPEGSELGDEAISEKGSKSSTASQPDSVSSLAKEKRISMWLGYPDCKDDGVEVLQIFKQGIETLSGSESPLVSQHEGILECDNFILDLTEY